MTPAPDVIEEDARLVQAWRGGDAAAGAQLVERHYDAIVRFFRTKAHPAADDLVQRTFMLCAERVHTLTSRWRPWRSPQSAAARCCRGSRQPA